MKKQIFNIAFYLLIFFLVACKKEKKDTQSPLVSISSPAEGQSFHMFDTITINAHVGDETHLASVVVSLNDLNNFAIQANYSVPIQGTDFSFTIHYPLTEYHLPSGFYYLSVSANDGTNLRQSTRKIYINESPVIKTGYYIALTSQPKIITRYDTTFNPKNTITLTTGFNGMAYGGYYHQLYINGNTNQAMQAIDPTNNDQPSWNLPYNVNSPFTCLSTDGVKPYVGYYGGSLMSLTNAGITSTTYTNSSSIYYPVLFTVTSQYGVGIYKDKTGGNSKLVTFGKNNGIAQNNNYTPCNVVAIFEHTADELYVLGNNASNQAVIYLYSVSNNSFANPQSLPPGKIISAVQVSPDFILFAIENGGVYSFSYSSGITPVLSSPVQKMFFQSKMNELTASYKNNLYIYSLSGNSLTLKHIQVLADTIAGFEVITNK